MNKLYYILIGIIGLIALCSVVSASEVTIYPCFDGYSKGESTNWASVHNANHQIDNNDNQMVDAIQCEKVLTTYNIERAIFVFNLSEYLPSEYELNSIEFGCTSYSSNNDDNSVALFMDYSFEFDDGFIYSIGLSAFSNVIESNFAMPSADNVYSTSVDTEDFSSNVIEHEGFYYVIICIAQYPNDYLNSPPSDSNDHSGVYFVEFSMTSKDPYLIIDYIANEPPVADNPVNGSGEIIDFPKPYLAFDLSDAEGDLITYYVKFGGTTIISEDTSYNDTIEYVYDDWESNLIKCLGTTYSWYVYMKDADHEYSYYTFTIKFDISPHPYEDMDCTPSYYWKILPSMNSSDVSMYDYRLVNESNNYTWYQAVDNDVVWNRSYYFNYDWETWVFNTTVPSYEGVLIALNNSDYNVFYKLQIGSGDIDESMSDSGYMNFSLLHDSWMNVSWQSWFNDSAVDTLETVLEEINSFVNWSEGGSCSGTYWINGSNENISYNISITFPSETVTEDVSVNEDNWLYIASLSLSPGLMLMFFISFFFYFASKYESFVLFLISGSISLLAGVYYLGWEVAMTNRIIGIGLLLFSVYCIYLAVGKSMKFSKA